MLRRRPEIDGARCVHAAIETASCHACVEICPKGAWHLDDVALELDTNRCDGCGLCVPACPRMAISLPPRLAIREVAKTVVMVVACEQVSTADDPGHIGCLHALSLSDLLCAYREERRVWLLTREDCEACPRGKAESLFSRVAHLNAMLRQRGLPIIELREISAKVSSSLLSAPTVSETRRGFFRALSRRPAAALLSGTSVAATVEVKPPGEYLPEGADTMLPWVVHLDPMRCVGCHACSRVCPEGAIQFDEEAPAYRLRHRACTGCELCRDVCASKAVVPYPWIEPTRSLVALSKQTCRRCGVVFYRPIEVEGGGPHCWICASARPAPRLYQVME
jgi:ferredoxin